MVLSKAIFIFIFTSILMVPAFAINSGLRGQIIRSRDFIKFKSERIELYRAQGVSQGKNAHETCIYNEWSKIKTDPPPPFYPYFGLRINEYRIQGARYAVNELEACIEHDYFNHHCEQHHDNSLICKGIVFAPTPIGEVDTPRHEINIDDAVKRAIDTAIEEAVSDGAVQSQ